MNLIPSCKNSVDQKQPRAWLFIKFKKVADQQGGKLIRNLCHFFYLIPLMWLKLVVSVLEVLLMSL
jgi:hypothetical protein